MRASVRSRRTREPADSQMQVLSSYLALIHSANAPAAGLPVGAVHRGSESSCHPAHQITLRESAESARPRPRQRPTCCRALSLVCRQEIWSPSRPVRSPSLRPVPQELRQANPRMSPWWLHLHSTPRPRHSRAQPNRPGAAAAALACCGRRAVAARQLALRTPCRVQIQTRRVCLRF